ELHIRRDQHWFDVLCHQLRRDPCELVGIVFDGVDKLQHLLWPYLDPALEPERPTEGFLRLRERCWDYFRQLDRFLGEVLAMVGEECTVFIVSDHGFTGTSQILHINTWLEQNGYLTWKAGMEVIPDDCRELEPDFYKLSAFDMGRTQAFALTASSNGIHIVKQQSPGGAGVPPHEYEAFRGRLRERLLTEVVDSSGGEPIVIDAWTREQAFFGPGMELAPDLTLRLRDDGFFSVRRSRELLTQRVDLMGTHHPEGVFVARGKGIRTGQSIAPIRLIDIVPTLLYTLGVPIPANLEGRLADEIFTPAHLRNYTALQGEVTRARDHMAQEDSQTLPGLPAQEEELVLERLRALGYLE
ncbi:MAG: alkaline phosphatase family protein, partial [Acidobacteriota bacterium]